MTNSKFVFDDITLKEVFGNVLTKWRRILCVALVGFILLGLAVGALDFREYKGKTSEPEETAKELEELKSTYEELEEKYEYYDLFMEKAVFINLNPAAVHKGSLVYSITTPLSGSEFDYAGNVAMAYRTVTRSGELSSYVAEKLNVDSAYIDQLFAAEYDAEMNPSQVVISAYESDTEELKLVLTYMEEFFESKNDELTKEFGVFSASIISRDETVVMYGDITTAKNNAKTYLTNVEDDMNDAKSDYENFAKTTTLGGVAKDTLIFAIVGFVVFAVLAFAYYFITILASSKVKSEKQLRHNYEVNVLGSVGPKEYKTKLDKKAYSWAGIEDTEYDEYFELINIRAKKIVGDKKCLVIPVITDDFKEEFENLKLDFSENAICTAKGINAMVDAEDVILIVRRFSTSVEKVLDSIETIKDYDKEFVGIILV